MDKSEFKYLRWSVENEVSQHVKDPDQLLSVVNSVMRLFVQAQSGAEVKRQRNNREFLTFRRSPDIQAPSWAYRRPGTVPVLPTLR